MHEPRAIELLSPARDADTGIEAVLHGADAVYIGAPRFGAREAASNSLSDISRLISFAHQYGAKVYATLNTIVYDSELSEARSIARALADAGIDALLIQDAAYLEMQLPEGVALHASTQCDNRTPEKIARLAAEGFTTAVLARELSLGEIAEIHNACPAMRLEAFVHGALCVSLSGRCYASQQLFGRSANRGACAQVCRMAFDLETDSGEKLLKQKHLLSLRDLNRTASLEAMLDAGVSSLKIEGRLKGTDYVKNITAWYRQRIDEILARRPGDYRRASWGETKLSFEPKPEKSFNRGFTEYFLHSRTARMACPATPKSIGEPVGEAAAVEGRSIRVAGRATFAAGDGLCFFTPSGELRGFRVNRAEGARLFLASTSEGLRPHVHLYRNHDAAFARALARPTAERTMRLDFRLAESPSGYTLSARDEAGRTAQAQIAYAHEEARTPQHDNVVAQLSRLGGTPFRAGNVDVPTGVGFIPSSLLATARREIVDKVKAQSLIEPSTRPKPHGAKLEGDADYSYNIANSSAAAHYASLGARVSQPAWEIRQPEGAPVMTCRYCLRHELGMCLKNRDALRSQLFLRLANGRRFRLEFRCKECMMLVYAEE